MGSLDKGETVKNFLKTLSDNNRLGILQDVCDKFGILMGAARGEIDLTVTSAGVTFSQTTVPTTLLTPLIIRNLTVRHYSV